MGSSSATSSPPLLGGTSLQYLGNTFWAASLENKPHLPTSPIGIGIINPGSAVDVQIIGTDASGTSQVLVSATGVVGTTTFPVAGPTVAGEYITRFGAYYIETTGPVYAFQFNPLDPVQSNDATLLLPTQSLGNQYRLVTARSDALPAYAAIVATQSGTLVTVEVPMASPETTLPMGQQASLTLSTPRIYSLDTGEVLNIRTPGSGDLTGTRVVADKPVAVFTGDICTRIGDGACNFLVEQMLPEHAHGHEYAVCLPPARSTETVTARVLGVGPGPAVVTTTPDVGQFVVSEGQWQDMELSSDVLVQSTSPVSVSLFLHGDPSEAHVGDPSFVQLRPTSSFGNSGRAIVHPNYPQSFLTLPSTLSSSITITGTTGTRTTDPIPGTSYACTRVEVLPGTTEFSSLDGAMGGQIYSFEPYGALAYSAAVDEAGAPPFFADLSVVSWPVLATLPPRECNPGIDYPANNDPFNPMDPFNAPVLLDFNSDADIFSSFMYVGGAGTTADPAVLHWPGCHQWLIHVKNISVNVEFADLNFWKPYQLTASAASSLGYPSQCSSRPAVFCIEDMAPGGVVTIRDFQLNSGMALLNAFDDAEVRLLQTPGKQVLDTGSIGAVYEDAHLEIVGVAWYGIQATTLVEGASVDLIASDLHTNGSWCTPQASLPSTGPLPRPVETGIRPYGDFSPTHAILAQAVGAGVPGTVGSELDYLWMRNLDARHAMASRLAYVTTNEAAAGLDFTLFDVKPGGNLALVGSTLGGAFIGIQAENAAVRSLGANIGCSTWGIVATDTPITSLHTKFQETAVPYKLEGSTDITAPPQGANFHLADTAIEPPTGQGTQVVQHDVPANPAHAFLSMCDVFESTHPAVVITDNTVSLHGPSFKDGFPVRASRAVQEARLYGGLSNVVPVPDNVLLKNAIYDPAGSGAAACIGARPTPDLPSIEAGMPEQWPCLAHAIECLGIEPPPVPTCDAAPLDSLCGVADGLGEEVEGTVEDLGDGIDPNHCRDIVNPYDPRDIVEDPGNTVGILLDPDPLDIYNDIVCLGVCFDNEDPATSPPGSPRESVDRCAPYDTQCIQDTLKDDDFDPLADPTFTDCKNDDPLQSASSSPESATDSSALATTPCSFPLYCLLDGTGAVRNYPATTIPIEGVVNVPLVAADLSSVHYLVLVPASTPPFGTVIDGATYGFYNFVVKPAQNLAPHSLGPFLPGSNTGGYGFKTELMFHSPATNVQLLPPTVPLPTLPKTINYHWKEESFATPCIPAVALVPCTSFGSIPMLTACISGQFRMVNEKVSVVHANLERAPIGCGNDGDGTVGGEHHFTMGDLSVDAIAHNRNPRRIQLHLDFDAQTNTAATTVGLSHGIETLQFAYQSDGLASESGFVNLDIGKIEAATYYITTVGRLSQGMEIHTNGGPYVDNTLCPGLGLPSPGRNLSLNLPTGESSKQPAAPTIPNGPAASPACGTGEARIGNFRYYLDSANIYDQSGTYLSLAPLSAPFEGTVTKTTTEIKYANGTKTKQHDFTFDGTFHQYEDQFFEFNATNSANPGQIGIRGFLRHLGAAFHLTASGTLGPEGKHVNVDAHQGYLEGVQLDAIVDGKMLSGDVDGITYVDVVWTDQKAAVVRTTDNAAAYQQPLGATGDFEWADDKFDFELSNLKSKAAFTFQMANEDEATFRGQVEQPDPYVLVAHYTNGTEKQVNINRLEFLSTQGAVRSRWHGTVLMNQESLELVVDEGAIGDYNVDILLVDDKTTHIVAQGRFLQAVSILNDQAAEEITIAAQLPTDAMLYSGTSAPMHIEFNRTGSFGVNLDWTNVQGPRFVQARHSSTTGQFTLGIRAEQGAPHAVTGNVYLGGAFKGIVFGSLEFVPDAAGIANLDVHGYFREGTPEEPKQKQLELVLDMLNGHIGAYNLTGKGLGSTAGVELFGVVLAGTTFTIEGELLQSLYVLNRSGALQGRAQLPLDVTAYHGGNVPLEVTFYDLGLVIEAGWDGVLGPKQLQFSKLGGRITADLVSEQKEPFTMHAHIQTRDLSPGDLTIIDVPSIEFLPDSAGNTTLHADFTGNSVKEFNAILNVTRGAIGEWSVDFQNLVFNDEVTQEFVHLDGQYVKYVQVSRQAGRITAQYDTPGSDITGTNPVLLNAELNPGTPGHTTAHITIPQVYRPITFKLDYADATKAASSGTGGEDCIHANVLLEASPNDPNPVWAATLNSNETGLDATVLAGTDASKSVIQKLDSDVLFTCNQSSTPLTIQADYVQEFKAGYSQYTDLVVVGAVRTYASWLAPEDPALLPPNQQAGMVVTLGPLLAGGTGLNRISMTGSLDWYPFGIPPDVHSDAGLVVDGLSLDPGGNFALGIPSLGLTLSGEHFQATTNTDCWAGRPYGSHYSGPFNNKWYYPIHLPWAPADLPVFANDEATGVYSNNVPLPPPLPDIQTDIYYAVRTAPHTHDTSPQDTRPAGCDAV